MTTQNRPERLIRLPEVLSRVGLKRSTWYARLSAGTAPMPVHLGPRVVAWRESEIDEFIAGQPKARVAA